MRSKTSPLRIQYFRKLVFLLLTSYVIFFSILCAVEFRKAIFDPSKFEEAAHEVTVFFFVGLASMPIAIYMAWRLTQQLVRPLKEMAQTADQISGGQFSRRIAVNKTFDELDQLAASFNLAFDRYTASLDRLRRFSGDAAHQLRTPLTSIRSTGETALMSARSSDEYARSIEQMLEDLRQLTGMVDQLLQLARLDAGTLQNTFVTFHPSENATRIIDQFAPLAEAKGITLESKLDDGVTIKGIPELADQTLANLLDNAIRHTPENGIIRVTLTSRALTVEDTGPGIPDAQLELVFEQFRTGTGGQNGLGLAIVKQITELHGGSVRAGNRPEGGAVFTIGFP